MDSDSRSSSKQSNKSRTSHICTTLSTFHQLSSRKMSRPTLLSGFEDIIEYITGLEKRVVELEEENKELKEELEGSAVEEDEDGFAVSDWFHEHLDKHIKFHLTEPGGEYNHIDTETGEHIFHLGKGGTLDEVREYVEELEEENKELKEDAKKSEFRIHYYRCFVNAVDPECNMMNNLTKEDVDDYTQDTDLAKRLCEEFFIDEEEEEEEVEVCAFCNECGWEGKCLVSKERAAELKQKGEREEIGENDFCGCNEEDEDEPEENVVVEDTQVDELPAAVVDTLQSDNAKREVQTVNGTTKYTDLKFDCEVGRIQFLMELEVTHGLKYSTHARTTAQNNLRSPQLMELWIEDDSQKKTITFMWYAMDGSMYGRQRVHRK